MSPPAEYVEVMEQFMSLDTKAVKIEGVDKTDAACLTMVAFFKELPIEVRSLPKKQVLLMRTDK